jgi:hypothetical protein
LFFVFILNPIVILSFKTDAFTRVSARSQLAQMLTQVQSKDFNPKSMTMILNKLREMVDKLNETQKKHEEVNKSMIAKCIEEDAFRATAVDEAQKALDASTSSLSVIQDGIKKTNKSITETTTNLDFNKSERTRASTQRDQELIAYNKFSINWNEGLKFMQDFQVEVLKNFESGTTAEAFSQLSEKFLKKSSHLNVLATAPAVLLTIKAMQDHNTYVFNSSGSVSDSLKEAIKTVINRILEDLKKVTERENNAKAAWTLYDEKLGIMIGNLETQLKDLKAHLVILLAGEVTEKAVIDAATSKLSRNGNLKDAAQNICKNFNAEFIEATKNRKAEVAVMIDILDIVKNRMGELPEGFEAYLISTEEGFAAYMNSTEFKAYEEYERLSTENNLSGENLTSEEEKVSVTSERSWFPRFNSKKRAHRI